MTADTMSAAEIKTFGDKLESFGKELSPKEQALLGDILVRAASAKPEDVQGYHYLGPYGPGDAHPGVWQPVTDSNWPGDPHSTPFTPLHIQNALNSIYSHPDPSTE